MILQDKEAQNFGIVLHNLISLIGGLEKFTPFLLKALQSYVVEEGVPQREVELCKNLLAGINGYYIVELQIEGELSWLKYATSGERIWVSSKNRAFPFLLKQHAVAVCEEYVGAQIKRKYRIAYKEEEMYESITP